MRTRTNDFKNEIAKMGRQIDGRIYHYNNYNLIAESGDTLLTEDNFNLVSEQINVNDKTLVNSENIYNISVVKNGQLLQSLMKELDFEIKNEFKVGDIVNAQLGVLVNGTYEHLNYGNYIIYSKEYNAENQTWNYVAYDYMIKTMLQYKPLDLIYPCTVRQYIQAIADRVGLTFTNSSDSFTNYDQQVLAELFEGQNITYRDILDKLSEIVAGNFIINDNDELEIGYLNTTNDTIDEEYLKDINVNFGEKFGPINRIVITQTDSAIEYPAEDSASIETNGLTQINIVDNEFVLNGDSHTIATNILTKLNGIYYYLNDFTTTGVCYYDFLDLFNVSLEGNIYQCVLFNNEINITQGIEENIFTNELENSETEVNNFQTSVMNNKEVSIKLNQQEGKIESKVEKDGVISAINQSAEEIQIQASKIKLEGYTTINNGFSVDENGNMSCNNANINNAKIKSLTAFSSSPIEIRTSDTTESMTTNILPCQIELDNTVLSGGGEAVEPSIQLYWDFWEVATTIGANGCYSPTFTPTSRAEKKKNFEKFDKGLETLQKIDIYKYNLKSQEDGAKKHIGFVIGDDYKYTTDLTDEKELGADLYSFVSVCCQAIKEQQEQIEKLEKRIEELERNDK